LTLFAILCRVATAPKISRSEPNHQLQRTRISGLRPLAWAAELRRLGVAMKRLIDWKIFAITVSVAPFYLSIQDKAVQDDRRRL
jgi:hypothetical protein